MWDKTDANPYMLIVLLHMKSLTAKYIYFNKSEEYICLNRDTRVHIIHIYFDRTYRNDTE